MADITVTAAQVGALVANGAIVRPLTAGAALSVGQVVYIGSDGKAELADASAASTADAYGIVVESYDGETSIAEGARCSVCVFGPVAGFSGMTPGDRLYVSNTAGALADAAGTTNYVVGYAESATVLFFLPQMSDPTS